MPIEIKELHIRVAVSASEGGASSPAAPASAAARPASSAADRDALVAECVEQVLHVLQEKSER